MEIGKRIRLFREALGLSQKELAHLIFVGEATIGHYETEKRIPPIDKLELLSNALDVAIEDLLYDTRKTEDDWFDYFYEDTKQAKKTMDETRFRLMLGRMFAEEGIFDQIEETEKILEIEDYVFSKTLAQRLLPLANETVNFNMMCRFPNHHWVINGFVGTTPFEFEIRDYGKGRARMETNVVMTETAPSQINEIAHLFYDWFKEEHLNYWINIHFEVELYLIKDRHEIRNKTIPNHIIDFSLKKRILDERNVRKKFWNIDTLLQTNTEDVASIPNIYEDQIEEIEAFKYRMRTLLNK